MANVKNYTFEVKSTTMIKTYFTCLLFLILLALSSCKTNPWEKIQGVYAVDKTLLKEALSKKTGSESALASSILDKAIENAVIEFKITGDSLTGLMFLVGEGSTINSKIKVRNDSMLIAVDEKETYLIPTNKGFLFASASSGTEPLELIKTSQKDFSKETKEAMVAFAEKQKKDKEFKDNLGKWRKGEYVDEFGDDTNQEFVYTIVPTTHENSYSSHSDLYTKVIITKDGKLYFEIFNNSLSVKENFPRSEFGVIKIKFPNDEIKSKKVFFGKNLILESPESKKDRTIYTELAETEGPLKLNIDLSTASEYYSDTYQFTLQRNNLIEMLNLLKES